MSTTSFGTAALLNTVIDPFPQNAKTCCMSLPQSFRLLRDMLRKTKDPRQQSRAGLLRK